MRSVGRNYFTTPLLSLTTFPGSLTTFDKINAVFSIIVGAALLAALFIVIVLPSIKKFIRRKR